MPTLSQDDKAAMVSFRCTEDFKRTLDIEVATQGVTMQDFCTRAIAEKLGVPAPGDESDPPRRKRAS